MTNLVKKGLMRVNRGLGKSALIVTIGGLLGCVALAQNGNAGRKETTLNKREVVRFVVVTSPLEFLAFYVENPKDWGKKEGSLRAYTDLQLDDARQTIREPDEDVRPLDRIVDGAMVNDGDLTVLFKDDQGKDVFLKPGQGIVVATGGIGGVIESDVDPCDACVARAVNTCGKGNVKKVNCGASGGCSFECFGRVEIQ